MPSASPPRRGRLNRRAAQVAREARDVSGRDAWVGGSIGPLGPPTRELRHPDDATIRAVYREQVDGLLEGGVDLLVIESFFDLHHLLLAVAEARGAADVPMIASMTFGEALVLADGTTPAEALAALADAGVDAVGRELRGRPARLPGRARPAGPPATGRAGPLGHAQRRPAATPRGPLRLRGGARLLRIDRREAARRRGGDDRRLLRHDARPHRGDARGPSGPSPPRTGAARRPAPTPSIAPARSPGRVPAPPSRRRMSPAPSRRIARRQTRLARALAERRFVDLRRDRPTTQHPHRSHAGGGASAPRRGHGRGEHQRLRDGQRPHGRHGRRLRHPARRERRVRRPHDDPRPQPDGPGAELLGAHALGVRNILALTGDPPRVGDYPTGTGVWDVDSIGLIEILTRLNRGRGPGGVPHRLTGPRSPSPAPSIPPPTTPRPSGIAWSASSMRGRTWS